MGVRDKRIARSILYAIFFDQDDEQTTFWQRVLAFFSLFQLQLRRYHDALFKRLRTEVWELDEDEYKESFRRTTQKKALTPVGDLGYSGSTFFTTSNSKYLIKSVPRRSENSFFSDELLQPYYAHNAAHPTSLLVRITDFLYTPTAAIGSMLGLAPSHHVVMENIMYGKTSDSRSDEWETYDLKPISYFYPERDIAGGKLASDATKDKLVDKFPDKIRVSASTRSELLEILELDTELLAQQGAIDYSLFLIRYPAPSAEERREIATLRSRSSPWRTGLPSTDGKWIYRAVILDFFWARHKFQAQMMSGLIKSYGAIAGTGDMSITTQPEEYRGRFLRMVRQCCEVEGEVVEGDGELQRERVNQQEAGASNIG